MNADDEFREKAAEAVKQVQIAFAQTASRGVIDAAELARMVGRATGLSRFPFAGAIAQSILVDLRHEIHRTFGAPGDWGYGTALGRALKALYELESPAGENADERG